jgi:protein involved in polysaccharide export with SLBB domain
LTVGKAVSLAGGYTDKADKSKIYILQINNDKLTVNENSFVSPGDNLVIEEYDPIFINGMVAKPGSYPYQEGLTIRKAVSLASGFHERASLSQIFIIKAKDKKQIPVKATLETPVDPGDTITVEESFF